METESVSAQQPPFGRPAEAQILAVGDELLFGDTVNTNAAFLGTKCREMGVTVVRVVTVRDRKEEIVAALQSMASTTSICFVCGGLGPTSDDLTTESVAAAAGADLVRDPEAEKRLEDKFRRFGRSMPDSNRKQADFPNGAEILPNPIGSAEGFAITLGESRVFVMPGVPRELHNMFVEQVAPRIQSAFALKPTSRRVFRSIGLGESWIAQRVEPLVEEARRMPGLHGVLVHYRASMPEVLVSLELRDVDDAARPAIERLEAQIVEALGPALYGVGEPPLAARVVHALVQHNRSLATAESCTGGGVARTLIAIAGASRAFVGSIVAYSNAVKSSKLSVPETMLVEHGAVSELVVRTMAEQGRIALSADLCVAISGIAGPDGGSAEKPVGSVHFAVADSAGCVHRHMQLRGDRGTVIRTSELVALKLVWDRLRDQGLASPNDLAQ